MLRQDIEKNIVTPLYLSEEELRKKARLEEASKKIKASKESMPESKQVVSKSATTSTKGASQVQTPDATGKLSKGGSVKDASGSTTGQGSGTAAAIQAGAEGLSALTQSGTADTSSVGETDTASSVGSGVLVGAGSGAAVGATVGGPVGGAIGAAVGAVVGGVGGALKASANRKREATIMFNHKMRQLAALEGEKEDRVQRAISEMGARMGSILNVQTTSF